MIDVPDALVEKAARAIRPFFVSSDRTEVPAVDRADAHAAETTAAALAADLCASGHYNDGTEPACQECYDLANAVMDTPWYARLAARSVVDAGAMAAAVRTLLPGLLVANYVERWATGSPAVQALSTLSEFVGEGPVAAGETVDPDVLSTHTRRPAGDAVQDAADVRRAVAEELDPIIARHERAARLASEGGDIQYAVPIRAFCEQLRDVLAREAGERDG